MSLHEPAKRSRKASLPRKTHLPPHPQVMDGTRHRDANPRRDARRDARSSCPRVWAKVPRVYRRCRRVGVCISDWSPIGTQEYTRQRTAAVERNIMDGLCTYGAWKGTSCWLPTKVRLFLLPDRDAKCFWSHREPGEAPHLLRALLFLNFRSRRYRV